MIAQTVLPGTDLSVSRFAFGTASLHHLRDAAERERLLLSAADAGFTHFDTAPLYGFGGAERLLAALFAARRGITVATKVGLYPPGGADQGETAMLARKAGGKLLAALSRPIADGSVARARASLDGSLRRLGRPQVDLLMIHEPQRALIATDEWQRWLEEERSAGRVRQFGLAGEMRRIAPFLGDPLAAVIQTADSIAGREAQPLIAAGRPLQLTYGYLSAALKGGTADAATVLAAALARNPDGAVLVSTRNPDRLGLYARLAPC